MSKPSQTGPYQAIVFDIDGTTLPNVAGGRPSQRVRQAIADHKDRIHLVAATGRPHRHALPILQLLGLTNPCVISGGSIILQPDADTILSQTTLPPEAVHAVYELAKGRGYEVVLRDERIDASVAKIHPTLAEGIEIIFIGLVPPEHAHPLKAALEAIPGIAASMVPDWYDGTLLAFNITHINATKEHAVADVLGRLGVPKEAAIGIGDGDNDLHLFKSVGLKIAMGNASPALKAAADLIAPSVDDDGLADIIERYAA